jgi:nucleotide-binding universal stress UspA family protein
MGNIRRILVPVDFSPPSRAAVRYAGQLAQELGATIDLLHIWRPPTFIPAGLMVVVPGAADHQSLESLAETEIAESMHALVAELKAERGIEARLRVGFQPGSPADPIVELAERGEFDLIVMGTHGRTGVARLFLGSVAERVARLSHCPVLIVPAPAAAA